MSRPLAFVIAAWIINGWVSLFSLDAQIVVRSLCGTGQGPITPSGTILQGETINAQTGTTYTYLNADCGKLVTHSNAMAIAATLPQANSSIFQNGWFADVQNIGAGTVTITPTVSTIDGAASLAVTTGQGLRIISNGSNYFTQRGGAGSVISGGTVTSVATSAPITGGTITTTGTIACVTCVTSASSLSSGSIVQGGGSQASSTFTLGGDCTFSTPNITCTKTGGAAFATSATTDTTNASNITSGSLAIARTTHYGASVNNTSTNSINNTTDTIVTFNSVQRDDCTCYSAGTPNRLTIPSGGDGWWQVSVSGAWDNNGTNIRNLSLWKNGAIIDSGLTSTYINIGSATEYVSYGLYLVATDYVQLDVWQNSGGTRTINKVNLTAERVN